MDWVVDFGLPDVGIQGHEFLTDPTKDHDDDDDAPPEGNAHVASSDDDRAADVIVGEDGPGRDGAFGRARRSPRSSGT